MQKKKEKNPQAWSKFKLSQSSFNSSEINTPTGTNAGNNRDYNSGGFT